MFLPPISTWRQRLQVWHELMGSISLWSPECGDQRQESFVKTRSSPSTPCTFPVDFSWRWMNGKCRKSTYSREPAYRIIFFSLHLQMVFFGYMVFSILFGLLADRYGRWKVGWPWRMIWNFLLRWCHPCFSLADISFVNNPDRMGGNVLLWHHVPEFRARLLAFSSFPGVPVLIPGPCHPGMELMRVHS